jgi:alpha/beta superfamily hydrolase
MSARAQFNKYLILLVFMVCGAACAQAPDYAREKRWADEITPSLVVGDAVYLAQPSGHKFLTFYTAHATARAGVIVVHGMGVHPDWNLIGVLRTQLAEAGYATLSLQMPVLAANARGAQYEALFGAAAERLQIAVKFLRDKGHAKIAIVSHSMGARMVNHFLINGGAHTIAAWVAVGLTSGEFAQPQALAAPVLDIFGEQDYPAVLAKAGQRAEAIRRIRGSGQISVAGADHFFTGRENELVRHVKLFLDKVTR